MDRLEYLRKFITRDLDLINGLEEESVGRDDIQPHVEVEIGKLLGLLVRLTGAKRVLELGSGIGFSALWLGQAVRATSGRLVTVDNHERTGRELKRNIEAAGLSDWVEIVTGDAESVIKELSGPWDIVFQDCGKYLYTEIHEDIVHQTRAGGLIIADDTLFKTEASVRKGLGEHMDRYNRMVFSDSRLYSTILPVGHGLTVSLKLED